MTQAQLNVLGNGTPQLPYEMRAFYEELVEKADELAWESDDLVIAALMRDLAKYVAAEGISNALRRTPEEWARGIALTAVIATLIDEPQALERESVRCVFVAAVGSDLNSVAQCTADVLVSAGVLDIGADWSLPS